MSAATKSAPSPSSKSAWKKKGLHKVTLPSGMVVTVRIPDLAKMLEEGAIPTHLRSTALRELIAPGSSEDANANGNEAVANAEADPAVLSSLTSLQRRLVIAMVVDPEITEEDFTGDEPLPAEDIDMLTEIATRDRVYDHLGVRLGVDPLSRWERFRIGFCGDPDCATCQEARGTLSEAHGMQL